MEHDQLYSFAFRGLLAHEALAKTQVLPRFPMSAHIDEEVACKLSLDILDDELVAKARRMSVVYTAIAGFENSVRKLISSILLEEKGENWWVAGVSQKIRQRAEGLLEEEKKVKWHTQRGNDLINYTTLNDLVSIMRNNWESFEPYVESIEWAANIFDSIERSRNVIMHSGMLEKEDIERLGIYIRDWVKQVGT